MADSQEHILVVISDLQLSASLDRDLRSDGYAVTLIRDGGSAVKQAALLDVSLVILGELLRDGSGLTYAMDFSRRLPNLPVILVVSQNSPELFRRAMHIGVSDVLYPPYKSDETRSAVRSALDLTRRRKEAFLKEAQRYTSSLQRQVDETDTLARLGRQITSTLNLDSVLSSIVDAAVQLTGAEEGSLLLIDELTGELYMRASKNFQEDFVRTFRLPITDSLAGMVIRTGEAVLRNENQPQKIKTSYLVQNLLYVPLQMQGHIYGVLGVDNRHSQLPLTQRHETLLNALSGYAVIALENARLYQDVTAERNKLEAILVGIQDGVVEVDLDHRLGMVNQAVRRAFGIPLEANLSGKLFQDIFPQDEMVGLLDVLENSISNRSEVSLDDKQVFSVLATPIQGVGRVITLHDITNLKKLDRIKTEFVNTVSHDLRSPLTAILGYVELIERAGKMSDLQRDFIRRIQISVHNITRLVDDLLDLGRIESGFDVRKENVRLDQIIHYSAEGMKKHLLVKGQHLQINLPADFPAILANPIQMRQMIDNLLDNAIKYTLPAGTIHVRGRVEMNQIIVQFCDTGIGIPILDLPYIFDKFYRAANASNEMSGTGLGLSIVKSIVEGHNGRIWVDSTVGKGAMFTIVLPLVQQ